MDPLDCQLTRLSAPSSVQVRGPDIAGEAPAYPQEPTDATTRRWNGALRLCQRLYAVTCVPRLSVRYEAPPPTGPKIIALNHANVTDLFLLSSIFPGPICFLAQANLFDLPVAGALLARAGHLPVAHGQWGAVLEAATRRLRQGYSLAVCPEGRLNHGGPLFRGRSGAVRLALHSGCPIVPVGFYVAERHTRVVRARVDGRETYGRFQVGGTCYVEVGRPWRPEPMLAGGRSYGQPQRLTNELMQQIGALVSQARACAAL